MKRLFLSLALFLPLLHAQEVEIIDVTGRSLRVTPVSVTADTAMVKRAGDKEPIAIPLEKLTAESVKRCREAVEKAMDQAKLDAEARLGEERKKLSLHKAQLKSGTVSLYTTLKDCSLDIAPNGDACILIAKDNSKFGFVWKPLLNSKASLRERIRHEIAEEVNSLPAPEKEKAMSKFVVEEVTFGRSSGFSLAQDDRKNAGKVYYLEQEGKCFYIWTASGEYKERDSMVGRAINQNEFLTILSTIQIQ